MQNQQGNMRFNKAELATLVLNPNTKFEKEGLLIITERQEGFFRRADVNYPRWCKLRGNLLFYLKDHDPRSQPAGLLVLENCRPVIRSEEREFDGFVFVLEFEGSLSQRISTRTAKERLDWVKSMQLASYSYLNRQIKYLEDQITLKMGNRIESGTPLCAHGNDAMWLNTSATVNAPAALTKVEEDLAEIPICESAFSCDNLPCDDHGRAPNPRVVCAVLVPGEPFFWRDYARTEVVENSKNPQFLCTMCFRQRDGCAADTVLRFTVYDVREKVSLTSVPIAHAEVALGVIKDATRFRIPLRTHNGDSCYITIASWAPDTEQQVAPPRSTTQVFEQQVKSHRRSQSLPSKLGAKLFVPFHGHLQLLFAHPNIHTYRLHSSIGGDISVQETLLESKLCFTIPQQLLSIWILREKELLQEISGMGELGGEWRRKQMDLLDKHLKLLKDYSQAKQNLQQASKEEGPFFKSSSVKTDESLEFIPVNLHLQRMCAQNDTLSRSGVLDIVTVGAFTRHSVKERTGGLIKLLQEAKISPSKLECGNGCKVQAANDAVQAVKQLRKEIVEIMSKLLSLAKSKNPKGMMPLCNEMVAKTKTLLQIWEPSLVEEAFAFIEQHRIIEEPDNVLMPMSPFRKITQQLSVLDLKSPELEDFATPVSAPPDLWPRGKSASSRFWARSNSLHLRPSPSVNDISAINTLHRSVKSYNEELRNKSTAAHSDQLEVEANFQSLPADWLNETGDAANFVKLPLNPGDLDEIANENSKYSKNVPMFGKTNPQDGLVLNNIHYGVDGADYNTLGQSAGFLDTKIMSTSPSANYYRPTEEPEPLDLTQLNIEASVMCLVSKIKFLCGRCGSPAIRLRHKKASIKRHGFANTQAPDVVVHDRISTDEFSSKDDAKRQFGNAATGLNLDLTQLAQTSSDHTTELRTKKGNKFTDGLALSDLSDWASELRPSMRKLRHAMDGLLKTARLMHSVQRLQQDMKRNSANLNVMYRRDVCFSQALTALLSALMAKLWATEITDNFLKILTDLGPLVYFEGLLSLYGGETDMFGDMSIAIEDLLAVNFTLVRSSETQPTPRVTGSRQSLSVLLPIPEHVYAIMPTKTAVVFKVTPIFFNVGINEKATVAETLGQTRAQHRSNWDNFVRLKQYYSHFRKLHLLGSDTSGKHEPHLAVQQTLSNLLNFMEEQLRSNVSKNVKILHLAEDACRLMSGLRFTSCKSAKDRTGMAVTLEQCRVLVQDFQLPTKSVPYVLSTMRSEGTRMDNVFKNIEKRKYAFNLPQVLSLPAMYRPPTGAYGKAET